MKSDSPIAEEVHRRRMAISARFDHDLEKYAAHLRETQRQHQAKSLENAIRSAIANVHAAGCRVARVEIDADAAALNV